MLEEGKLMLFEPAILEVRLGEQIRFVIYNEGTCDNHEFILATKERTTVAHGELMKKFPNMEHDDPNVYPGGAARPRRNSLEVHQAR